MIASGFEFPVWINSGLSIFLSDIEVRYFERLANYDNSESQPFVWGAKPMIDAGWMPTLLPHPSDAISVFACEWQLNINALPPLCHHLRSRKATVSTKFWLLRLPRAMIGVVLSDRIITLAPTRKIKSSYVFRLSSLIYQHVTLHIIKCPPLING